MMRMQFWGRLLPGHSEQKSDRPIIVAASSPAASVAAHEAFTPTQPCSRRAALIGRERELDIIVQSLSEDRAHVVLYSDRGWGKTSVAAAVVEILRQKGLVVARTQCEAGSTFDGIIRGLIRTLPSSLVTAPICPDALEGCEAALPARPVCPEDVVTLLLRLRVRAMVCVIDEFDRVSDLRSRTMLADTIKQLSDRGVPLLFMIIGVSGSLEQLIGQHPSIQRNLVSLGLSLLSDAAIAEIIVSGAARAGLTFPANLIAAIVAISRGMPYFAQLLGLRTAQAAARRGASSIGNQDLQAALSRLSTETPPRVARLYDELTSSGRNDTMTSALRDVGQCVQDRWGRMVVVETAGDTVLVGGRRVDKSCLLSLRETGVLRPADDLPDQVAFSDRSLLYHILVKAAERDGAERSPSDPGGRNERQLAVS